MKFAYFVKRRMSSDPKIQDFISELKSGGATVYKVETGLEPDTDVLVCFGGDGTFLSGAHLAAPAGVPIVGVNIGRLGFLSENATVDMPSKLLAHDYSINHLSLLQADAGPAFGTLPFALNEVCISHNGTEAIGIEVEIDGAALPTYWADGLMVATSSGSTAYNLSAGGPVCLPSSPVFIVSPIAPHNLGVRPLVIPSSSKVELGLKARSGLASLSVDNCNYPIVSGTKVSVQLAPVTADRLCFGESNFIEALRSRFYWGQDRRNTTE